MNVDENSLIKPVLLIQNAYPVKMKEKHIEPHDKEKILGFDYNFLSSLYKIYNKNDNSVFYRAGYYYSGWSKKQFCYDGNKAFDYAEDDFKGAIGFFNIPFNIFDLKEINALQFEDRFYSEEEISKLVLQWNSL